MNLKKSKLITLILAINSLLALKALITYRIEVYPYREKLGIMNINIANGMTAMRLLAKNSKTISESNSASLSGTFNNSTSDSLDGEVLVSWKQQHSDGLLYCYDTQLDFEGTALSNGTDITNLALVKINTYNNISILSGEGVKSYTFINNSNKYVPYKLALVSYDNSLDTLALDNINFTETVENTYGITIHDGLAYIEQGLVDGVSRIEYDNNDEKVYLNYTFDIIGDKDKLKELPKDFNLDIINKYNGASYSDKLESIAYKFDNSKYITDNKDYVQLSLTVSLVFDPEYINALLSEVGDNSINFKSIGYAQNSFSNLFVFRVNSLFDINLN